MGDKIIIVRRPKNVAVSLKRTIFIRQVAIRRGGEHLRDIEEVPDDGQRTRSWGQWELLLAAADVLCDGKDEEDDGCNDDQLQWYQWYGTLKSETERILGLDHLGGVVR